jgi:hypothetical protein
MRKRALLWAGLLVVLAGVGLLSVQWWATPPPGVSVANAHRLKAGMSESEVAALLGCAGHRPGIDVPSLRSFCWQSDEVTILAAFYPDTGLAQEFCLLKPNGEFELLPRQMNLLARLCRWLGL